MSWKESVLYFDDLPHDEGLEVLLGRNQPKCFYKAKSDYVKEPISEIGLEGIWKRFHEVEQPVVIFTPFGGKMSEISEREIPYPHRAGNIYEIQYLAYWEPGNGASKKHISWIRRLYSYMAPYVSMSPREAYNLGLPVAFVRIFLPQENQEMILWDPNNKAWPVKYIYANRPCKRGGFSAGWGTFATGKNLELNDVCVFELLKAKEMRVHIFRVVEEVTPPIKGYIEKMTRAVKQNLSQS